MENSNGESLSEKQIDVMLQQYLQLRNETMENIRQHNQRILSGIASLGLITGYALLAEDYWIVSVTPFILGLMMIQSFLTQRYLAAKSSASITLENRLSDVTPIFRWEKKYGGFYGDEPELLRKSPSSIVGWDDILRHSLSLLAILVYLAAIYLSYITWESRPTILSSVDIYLLTVSYLIVTVLIACAGGISLKFVQEVDPTS
ncbi:hypothetical protein [Halorussus halophilus]|uniref:hypothetical protein n=1 Tax=Halorussus halophilus TaxID=2650975 RepID=UPI0013018945|nr:hypothetical protein [Halorussus halophilus]